MYILLLTLWRRYSKNLYFIELVLSEPAVQFLTRLPDVTMVPLNTDAEFTVELSQDVEVKWFK